MSFEALVGRMDDVCVSTFQRMDPAAGTLPVTIHFNDGRADATVPCIVKSPVMEEDYVPGSQQGTGMLILFVPASAGLGELRGSTATYNGVLYNILQSDADRCGGMHIRLRAEQT
jgi:hypothetical protein